MSRFGMIMTTQALVKQHLMEARIRFDSKDHSGALRHLLSAIDAQRTSINILADRINHPNRKKKAVKP